MAKNKGMVHGTDEERGVTVPRKRTSCPITRKDFQEHAKPLAIKVGEETKVADLKEFSSGSFGWYCNEKLTVVVNGVPVKVQAQLQLTVIGSKELAVAEAGGGADSGT